MFLIVLLYVLNVGFVPPFKQPYGESSDSFTGENVADDGNSEVLLLSTTVSELLFSISSISPISPISLKSISSLVSIDEGLTAKFVYDSRAGRLSKDIGYEDIEGKGNGDEGEGNGE